MTVWNVSAAAMLILTKGTQVAIFLPSIGESTWSSASKLMISDWSLGGWPDRFPMARSCCSHGSVLESQSGVSRLRWPSFTSEESRKIHLFSSQSLNVHFLPCLSYYPFHSYKQPRCSLESEISVIFGSYNIGDCCCRFLKCQKTKYVEAPVSSSSRTDYHFTSQGRRNVDVVQPQSVRLWL